MLYTTATDVTCALNVLPSIVPLSVLLAWDLTFQLCAASSKPWPKVVVATLLRTHLRRRRHPLLFEPAALRRLCWLLWPRLRRPSLRRAAGAARRRPRLLRVRLPHPLPPSKRSWPRPSLHSPRPGWSLPRPLAPLWMNEETKSGYVLHAPDQTMAVP